MQTQLEPSTHAKAKHLAYTIIGMASISVAKHYYLLNATNSNVNTKYLCHSCILEISLLLRFTRYTICCIFESTVILEYLQNASFFRRKMQIFK